MACVFTLDDDKMDRMHKLQQRARKRAKTMFSDEIFHTSFQEIMSKIIRWHMLFVLNNIQHLINVLCGCELNYKFCYFDAGPC